MAGQILLSCDGLTKAHGSRTLFEGLSLGIREDERIGLIGPNGSGKTTLLRVLAGVEPADRGDVSKRRGLRLGWIEQIPDLPLDLGAEEIVIAALVADGAADYEASSRAGIALGRAGFDDLAKPARALSGGWRKRLAIARELAREPDVLLLDEPTNHLDVEGILWLEEVLAEGSRACLVVSHDRWFLQRVANRMIELSRTWPTGLFASEGTYVEFLERREAALGAQVQREQVLANAVRREIEWLRRGPKARTTKSQARISSAHALQDELADVRSRNTTRSAGLDLSASDRRSKRLLAAEGVSKSLGGKPLLRDLDLTLGPGTRIGLIGPNGSGKTTLLRLLAGELQPDAGTIWRAPSLSVARFEQGRESLVPSVTLARALAPEGDAVTFRGEQVHVSSWARRFLFRSEQLQVPVSHLSGGEQARIVLARLMLRPADLLLMDEPTNDLDIPTLEVLEETLAGFPGALVLVTHDRFLLDRVATSVVSLDGAGNVGHHADLAQWQASRASAASAAQKEARAASRPAGGAQGGKKLTWQERKDLDQMEKRILDAETALTRCREASEDPAIATNAKELAARHAALEAAQSEVERLYARWAELEAKQGA